MFLWEKRSEIRHFGLSVLLKAGSPVAAAQSRPDTALYHFTDFRTTQQRRL